MLEMSTPKFTRRRKRLLFGVLGIVVTLGSMVGIASAKTNTIEYRFVFVNGVVIDGIANSKTTFLVAAGGTSIENPTGIELHLSCSDDFEDGWGHKGGPKAVNDSAWQIASFGITKGKKTCGDIDATTGLPIPVDAENEKKAEKSKQIEFRFDFVNGETISGTSDSNSVFMASAGGPSVANPTGMEMHVSCSDTYPDGWGEKGGPVEGVDTGWEILDWGIRKGDKTCGHVDPLSGGDFPASAGDEGEATKKTKDDKAKVKSKVINYSFLFENGVHIEGVATTNTVFIPDVGGVSVLNPSGVDMHVSCSDDYSNGWGAKGGPIEGVDTAWKIDQWFISKTNSSCGTPFIPPPDLSSDNEK